MADLDVVPGLDQRRLLRLAAVDARAVAAAEVAQVVLAAARGDLGVILGDGAVGDMDGVARGAADAHQGLFERPRDLLFADETGEGESHFRLLWRGERANLAQECGAVGESARVGRRPRESLRETARRRHPGDALACPRPAPPSWLRGSEGLPAGLPRSLAHALDRATDLRSAPAHAHDRDNLSLSLRRVLRRLPIL